MNKPKIALIRGKFMTKYDMETFEKLDKKYDFTAFASKYPIQERFSFSTEKLYSPMDLPDFPLKLPIMNRLMVDAHYLFGLEGKLKGFDIAHTAETYFNFTQQAISAKKKGYVRKIICTNFENIPYNNEGIRGRKDFKQRTYKNVDHFIGVTNGAKKVLVEEGVSEKKISVISMGIDTSKFKPSKKKNSKVINILFAGRIEEYKGVFDLIEAFNIVHKEGNNKNNLRLKIIGKGSKEQELRNKIKEYRIEKFVKTGAVPHEKIPDLYQDSDIFIGPSKRDKYWVEQFGMVFLEAMASGLPIISTKSGAIPEVIGDSGILVPEGDVKGLVNSIKILITSESKRKELGIKARKRAVSYFDTSITSKKIDSIYQKVLS